MPDISIVLGLGNPGEEYAGTRHNLGYDTLDILASRHGLGWKRRKGVSLEAGWRIGGRRVVLIKPLTYMNLSGDALSNTGASPESLLVVCDDIHLPLGLIRIKAGGGSGGHRGLESVSRELGTTGFTRLRLGVGPAPAGEQWSDFVLDRFTPDQRDAARGMAAIAADAVESIILEGIDAAQRLYNSKAGAEEERSPVRPGPESPSENTEQG